MGVQTAEDGRRTGTVGAIVRDREFVFADCLVVGGRAYEYGWDAGGLVVGTELSVDSDEYGLAGFDERDRLEAGPIIYSCGATLASRSSGYFMKTVGDQLAWLLVCTASEAFTAVRRRRDGVEFASRFDERWVLPAEDVTAVFIEPSGRRADTSWPLLTVPASRRSIWQS